MRSILSFVGGLVVAALIFGAWFFISEKRQNATPGRYQLILGKTPGSGATGEFNKMETVFRIDTATGRTWQLLTNPQTVSYWWEIGSENSNDPLFPRPSK